MLSEKMEKALNRQIADEAYASQLYLSMATWCGHSGLSGAAKFFFLQAEEERQHMLKIVNHAMEVEGRVIVLDLSKPPSDFDSLKGVIEKALDHEQSVTASINGLVEASLAEKDYATFNFLQWFVDEQVEEEQSFKSLQDTFDLVGTDGHGVYMVDKKMGQRDE